MMTFILRLPKSAISKEELKNYNQRKIIESFSKLRIKAQEDNENPQGLDRPLPISKPDEGYAIRSKTQ